MALKKMNLATPEVYMVGGRTEWVPMERWWMNVYKLPDCDYRELVVVTDRFSFGVYV